MLDAPSNKNDDESPNMYSCQMCISWPDRPGFLGEPEPTDFPPTNDGKLRLIRSFAERWAEPFRSLALGLPPETDVKQLELFDYAPPKGLRSSGRVVLMGDAFHAMAMCKSDFPTANLTCLSPAASPAVSLGIFCFGSSEISRRPAKEGKHRRNENLGLTGDATDRGEGANHAILDVLDFADKVVPKLADGSAAFPELRASMDAYEDGVVARARPGVLASRRACLDAHDWPKIGPASPLLSKREMFLQFDEK